MGYVDALIVGLGNPGSKYARTRHNIGWMAVDALLAEQGAKTKDKYNGRYAEVRLGEVAVGVLAPETFMNDSGRSVGACGSRLDGLNRTARHREQSEARQGLTSRPCSPFAHLTP